MIWQIGLTALISCLLLIVEHYWPTQAMIKRPLNKLWAYTLGTLAIQLPFTVLMIVWDEWVTVYALWTITLLGGLVVAAVNQLDIYLETRTRMEISEHEAQSLRPGHGADDR
ncbi:MAG: hypothetical protein ACYC36_00170 [Bellilinea sp.]